MVSTNTKIELHTKELILNILREEEGGGVILSFLRQIFVLSSDTTRAALPMSQVDIFRV